MKKFYGLKLDASASHRLKESGSPSARLPESEQKPMNAGVPGTLGAFIGRWDLWCCWRIVWDSITKTLSRIHEHIQCRCARVRFVCGLSGWEAVAALLLPDTVYDADRPVRAAG